MGEPLRLNLYAYALNNPVILDDHDGTDLALLGFGLTASKILVGVGAAFGAVLSSPVTLTALAVGTAVVGARVYQATRAQAKERAGEAERWIATYPRAKGSGWWIAQRDTGFGKPILLKAQVSRGNALLFAQLRHDDYGIWTRSKKNATAFALETWESRKRSERRGDTMKIVRIDEKLKRRWTAISLWAPAMALPINQLFWRKKL